LGETWNALHLHGFTWRDAIDILVVAVLVYALIHQVRGTRAVQMLLGILVLAAGNAVARWVGLVTLNRVLENLLFYAPFAVIVLFQPTIQRALASLGSLLFGRSASIETARRMCHEISQACFDLGARRHGAIVVLERTQGLKNYAETGIWIRAEVTRDLISTLFFPGTPLHDGAIIITDGQILAAACFLPLTERDLPIQYGTRHRAAVGITEETDAIAVVVSEERGTVSLAAAGELREVASVEELEKVLATHRSGGNLE
jgi:diadenylate cyclase